MMRPFMKSSPKARRTGHWSVSLLLIACSTTARAADITWNTNAGDWHNPTNWTPLGLPDDTSHVRVGGPAAVNISSADAFSLGAHVGNVDGPHVVVSVMNGRTWNNGGNLLIGTLGVSGSGAVNVIGGSTVHTHSFGNIGGVGANGTLNVLGSGSLWTDAGTLSVGIGGNGILYIADGGRVESSQGYIATSSSDSSGEVTVTGTGSVWKISNSLTIGHMGSGSLTVSNGGLVESANVSNSVFSLGEASTIDLLGTAAARGELRTGYIRRIPSLEQPILLNFDGGILRATENGELIRDFTPGSVTIQSGGAFIHTNYENTIPIGMTGSGGLTKTGGGTLALSGTNTYAGITEVRAGTLAVNGSLQGTGGVTVYDGSILQGDGSIAGETEIYWGGRLSPGNSTGELFADDMTWHGGGEYFWEIDDARHDHVRLSGTLDIQSDPGTPFQIGLHSLLAADAGPLASWNPGINQEWIILTAFGGIDGFEPANFFIDDSGFADYNDLAGGSFHLGVVDVPISGSIPGYSNLVLHFTIPEPSAALLAALGCLSLGARRRS